AYGLCFALGGAFPDAEGFVDSRQLHMRLLAAVVEVIYPADDPYDSAGPQFRLSSYKRGWPLPRKNASQFTAEHLVFVGEADLAESIGEPDDGVIGRLGPSGDGGLLDERGRCDGHFELLLCEVHFWSSSRIQNHSILAGNGWRRPAFFLFDLYPLLLE